ncbi:MAG: hypothetical protein HYV76_02290 [Candidatus Vogelbacteria bacterium]|nr:hypothetical protein [Candidatus Vogelbacteria bacterium]
MKVLTVAPITNRLPLSELTYFTKEQVTPGALVEVTINKRVFPALVLAVNEAGTIKQSLRTSTYALKKIKRVISLDLFLPPFMSGVKAISDWYQISPGVVLKTLIPAAILDNPILNIKIKKIINQDVNLKNEIKALQQPWSERLASYKGLIREMLAKNQSVMIIFPGTADIAQAAPILGRGLEDYIKIFSGRETKIKIKKTWKESLAQAKPVIIIGTPLILSLPRPDIGLVILDQENNTAYKQFIAPYFDLRHLVKEITTHLNWPLLLGDTVLSLDTLYKLEQKEYTPAGSLRYRLISEAKTTLIDGRSQTDIHGKKIFSVITDEVKEKINRIGQNNGSVFIFSARKGLAPTTICNDCGTTVVCPTCQTPLVVHRHPPAGGHPKNVFYCHHCGTRKEIDDKCVICGSWRLASLGIGTERVAETLASLLPNRIITIVDADHTPTPIKIKSALETLNQPGGIVVGTELALNYLPTTISLVIVAGIDSLFMVPDYQMNERIFNILIDLKSRATRQFLIQTRHPETALFHQALEGNIAEFYREELTLRQKLDYPPFKLLIKGSLTNPKIKVNQDRLENLLKPWQPLFYEHHFLLKLKADEWPSEELAQVFSQLQPNWQIDINPTSLM